MELMVLIVQTASVAFLALWLTTGVRDNILYPSLNEVYVAQVLDLERMREEYPEAYAFVAHRRVSSRTLQRAFFRAAVAWELLSTVVLWVGTLAMVLAVLGIVGVEGARVLGLLGALMFTGTWAMFLVVGNHFCYWFGHEGGQNTHYLMTLWGLATMILIVVG